MAFVHPRFPVTSVGLSFALGPWLLLQAIENRRRRYRATLFR
jgi:hypothetical protein